MQRFLGCALALLLPPARGEDGVSLVQHSLAPHTGFGFLTDSEVRVQTYGSTFESALADRSIRSTLGMASEYSQMMEDLAPKASLAGVVRAGKRAAEGSRDALAQGWKAFYARSRNASAPTPQDLLQNAKAALLETGALEQMRHLAFATADSSKALSRGAVPLDSMVVGFKTSLAPWNNVLKAFSLPLIKASFTLFANFFGPEGNAARLCLSTSTVADSTYGVHTRWEFGGINIFAGPAKWDNVPGWNFGAGGGLDDLRRAPLHPAAADPPPLRPHSPHAFEAQARREVVGGAEEGAARHLQA